jgi:UDP-N-acetylmuramoyl-L-alanyl-D-glutamate--2,6-diaminopimelate ligase
MAEAAGRNSDFVVLTSDNPRSEDPQAILSDALPALRNTGVEFTVKPDRREAIRAALGQAQPGDIVLLAGKGHEKFQILREGPVPFDDVEVARELLSSLGYSGSSIGHNAQGPQSRRPGSSRPGTSGPGTSK